GLWAQPRLLEAGGGLRAPGDSLLLSCHGEGLPSADRAVWWYRQSASGSLEWVSLILYARYGTGKFYGTAVEGRATVVGDDFRSESSL
ncbi:HV349 protein, partial [Turnix velox]|nr:HV349 protein [Turnix velox]